MKEFKDNYNASDIDILDGLDPVRKRPAMYIGSTNVRGLHHLVWEIVDNAVDEAINGYGNSITVIIHKDGSVSVQDEGRGIPVDIHENSKKPAVEVLFTVLHSGGKFNSKAYRTSGGLHGVGASVTNALSVYCDVTIFKNGLINHIRFENGGKLVVPLEVLGKTKKHGTLVRFKPDPTIFPTVVFNFDTIAGTHQ
ncbi:MAG: ATP-binding protein [Bacilli bacterium]|nr:ATP-binding protein [Bacilli bacterium]